MNKFKIGQSVVHLSHGVGEILGREKREFTGGVKQEFFILQIIDNGAPKKVFVPVDCANERLRHLITEKEVDFLYQCLSVKTGFTIDHQTWNRRYREYMERIHTGNIFEIVTVLKSLHNLRVEKELSFGERKLFDQAKSLVVKEISLVEGCSEKWIEKRVDNLLSQNEG